MRQIGEPTMTSARALRRRRWGPYAVVALLILGAVSLRIWGIASLGLWYDELQSVTHAGLSLTETERIELQGRSITFPQLLASVAKFDFHPPLYYVQLHFWMLAGNSDVWIKLNSVLFSLITGLSLLIIGRRLFSPFVGALSCLLFALSPIAIYYSQEARMYALLMALSVWVYFLTHEFFVTRRAGPVGILLACATAAYLYSHGAAFLILPSMWSYALFMFATREADPRRLKQFALVNLSALAAAAPWLYLMLTRSVGHTVAPDLSRILRDLAILICGYGGHTAWFQVCVLGVVLALLVAAALRSPQGLRGALSFFFVPVVACAAVSYLIRPIWLVRSVVFTVPFLCLFTAVGIESAASFLPSRFRTYQRQALARLAMACVVALLLSCSLVVQHWTLSKVSGFREAALWCHRNIRNGEVILVPHERDFWGFSWYFIGPRQVNPLRRGMAAVRDGVSLVHRVGKAEELSESDVGWVVVNWTRALPFAQDSLVTRFRAGSVRVQQILPSPRPQRVGAAEREPEGDP